MSLIWTPKDPAETVDYEADWTTRLAGDTIASSVFALVTAAGLVLASQTNTTTKSTAWLSGGTAGQTGKLTSTITTAGGRTMVESIILPIAGGLVVEDGSGVSGAESYASIAYVDAYWAARPQSAFATTWAAASLNKEGAAREATAYVDANWGPYYLGKRRGFVQGLLFPRTDAFDEQGYPLPDLPSQLQAAVAELSARAITAALAPDTDSGTRVKSLEQTVGPISKVTEYFDPLSLAPKVYYSFIDDMLAPILNGSQPSAPNGGWAWS